MTSGKTQRLGIIGGGQLGLFLCQRAASLGVTTAVLSPESDCPASHVADLMIAAPMDDGAAVEQLIEASDVITFELEAVPDSTLQQIRDAQEQGRVRSNPDVDLLALIKDKGSQKIWLQQSGLATLPFVMLDADAVAATVLASGIELPLVQKARRGGYDGKGVQILRDQSDLDGLWPVPSYIEPAHTGVTEVAVVIARDTEGRLVSYPPALMDFNSEFNSVETIEYPASLPDTVLRQCADLALEAITALAGVGVFAVELFITEDQQIVINEISPRVHNSGHLTMDGFTHDQFEQHVRAVMGMPLAEPTAVANATVMFNLLYNDRYQNALAPTPYAASLGAGSVLHWYGKTTPAPGRKMGHLNATGDTLAAAQLSIESALRTLAQGGPIKGEQQ
ncbi:phosphoribosylaminoimidazole carboxylase atpase subunit [Luminiphilus syltensis NOR5-1B]|uniref:N5-carboxyaminoimidazole ribonucleotide synthase n=2 Tax=Luminiphilus TaxID=1341118 RepID=B8KWP7_9GAMM|nr:phosphoribosylaminoimidazole carboxylase atpase subunit [Luminiphilus syltensis NOR5-1B]